MPELSRRGFIGSAAVAASLVESTAGAMDDAEDASATAQAWLVRPWRRSAQPLAAGNSIRENAICSRRRLEARLALSKTKADRVAAAQEHVDEMKAVEQLVIRMDQAGQVDRLVKMDAEYRRLEAESWLEREKMSKA